MLNMTWQGVESLARNILQFVGGYVVGAGILTSDQWTLATGAVLGIGAFLWSLFNKQKLLKSPAV